MSSHSLSYCNLKAGGSEWLVFRLRYFSSTSQRSTFRFLQWSVVVSSNPENTGMLILHWMQSSKELIWQKTRKCEVLFSFHKPWDNDNKQATNKDMHSNMGWLFFTNVLRRRCLWFWKTEGHSVSRGFSWHDGKKVFYYLFFKHNLHLYMWFAKESLIESFVPF